MTNFLFWNINKKVDANRIATISWSFDVDVLMLAECTTPSNRIVVALNKHQDKLYDYDATIGCEKIRIYTRFKRDYIRPVLETERVTIRNLSLPGQLSILLMAVHFPSKRNWSEASQTAESSKLAGLLHDAEKKLGHARSVLVGDLNMNPFEPGMVNANGLHGVMSRNIAAKNRRTVQGSEYLYFYNPMWSLLGDATPGPPGTYYYSRAEHTVYFWNMFDQVLIRPDLLGRLEPNDVKIVTTDGVSSLLNRNDLPDKTLGSDHLPILFKIDL